MKNVTFISAFVAIMIALYQYKHAIKIMLQSKLGGITELSHDELEEVTGGIIGLLIAAFAAGVAVYAATHDSSTACPAV